MGRKAQKDAPTMPLITALDGTFNKQAWADHFAATLSAHVRETKSQADILRAICIERRVNLAALERVAQRDAERLAVGRGAGAVVRVD